MYEPTEKVHFIHLGMRSINYIASESVLFRFFTLASRQDEICSKNLYHLTPREFPPQNN